MRKTSIVIFAVGFLYCSLGSFAADDYKLGPDSQFHEGVPKGDVTHYTFESKSIFPGTTRDYWVYVPKQYDSTRPACVMVFQDGGGFQDANGGFRVPVVFDNLINCKEMPVTIAIMVNPGVAPALTPNALPRYNRSYEYDDPTDTYARFLLEELLPEVAKKYNLSTNANDRGLCGASSGGICSFTAAWERSDAFSRVISFIGSFTNLRGGHSYPALIRKTESKPLRIYLQDGTNDQDIYSGSWYIGNQDVAAALRFGRYDYQFVVGDGGHSGRHGGAILPDALKWLWRDYPNPIVPAAATPQPIMEVLAAGEGWKQVTGDFHVGSALAVDSSGAVYFSDSAHGDILKMAGGGTVEKFRTNIGIVGGLAFDANGRLNWIRRGRELVASAEKADSTVAKDIRAETITINRAGVTYYADSRDGSLWMLDSKGKKQKVDAGLTNVGGVTLTPDQSLLIVSQRNPGKYALSFRVHPDGTLSDRQLYFDLHVPYGTSSTGAAQMTTDTDGRLYVASDAAIQVCDQAGRVIGMILNPAHKPTTAVAFGGAGLDTLYAVCDGKLYVRKTKVKGVLSFKDPVKPAAPRL